jgi:hypothetical protein
MESLFLNEGKFGDVLEQVRGEPSMLSSRNPSFLCFLGPFPKASTSCQLRGQERTWRILAEVSMSQPLEAACNI